MKAKFKIIAYLLILGMMILIVKPVLLHQPQYQVPQKTQYSASTAPCNNRTVTVSCQSTVYYTLTDEYSIEDAYILLLTCLLYFILTQSNYNSPYSRIFKPPILTH